MSSVKQEWERLMARAEVTGVRDLARKASKQLPAGAKPINASTITRMMEGVGARGTSRPVLDAVAKALKVSVTEVDRLHGLARTEAKPFKPHDSADLLTSDERDAINELIRLMTWRRRQGGEGDGNAAPSKTPDPGPADQPGLTLVADPDDTDIEPQQETDST